MRNIKSYKPVRSLFAYKIAIGFAFSLSVSAYSEVPGILGHQGKLSINGTNYTGNAQFKFALVNAQGNVTFWSYNGTSSTGNQPTGTPLNLEVLRGVYSVNLGDTNVSGMLTPISDAVFTNSQVYLRTWVSDGVNGFQLLVPDRRIVSGGFSLVASKLLNPPASATNFSGNLTGDVVGTQGATIVNAVGGVSSTNIASAAVIANAATSTNIPGTVVKRDTSGNVSVGTINGSFTGNGAGLTNVTASRLAGAASSATNFSGTLAGDVTGTQEATVVNSVGGISAATVSSGASLAASATRLNLPNTIVRRDASGSFDASSISGIFWGDGVGLTNVTAIRLLGAASTATNFSGDLLGDVTGTQQATTVGTVGGVAASLVASGATLANAATSTNLSGTIVRRDTNGNFSAGVISGAFVGNGAGLTNISANRLVGVAPIATNFIGALAGDVTGNQGSTVVSSVGGVSAVNLAAGANAANSATYSNLPGTVVRRDANGSFNAGVINGAFVGNAAGLTNVMANKVIGTVAAATNFSGVLAGDVTGNQASTVVETVGGVTATEIAVGVSVANAATSTNAPDTLVRRDTNGNFSAGIVNGTFVGNGSGLTNVTANRLIGAASTATNFSGALSGDVTGSQAATVVGSVAGVAASNIVSGALAANAATSANTPNTLVRRDGSGNFTAGTVSGAFVGNGGGLTNILANKLIGTAPVATNFSGVLQGDVTGLQGATVVETVGGAIASNIATATMSVNAATSTNAPETLVRRDTNGNFSAGVVSGTFVGDGAGLSNVVAGKLSGVAPMATNFSGILSGDVTGNQSTTVVGTVGGASAASVATAASMASASTSTNLPNTLVRRDASGNFSGGNISGAFSGDGSNLTNVIANKLVGVAPVATNFIGSLAGDVTGTQGATVVGTVGGATAADVASATAIANAATSTNLSNTVVRRNANGDIAVGLVSGAFSGDGSALTNVVANKLTGIAPVATNFSGALAGDVIGGQGATIVNQVGGVSSTNVASGATIANAATSTNLPNTVVRRDTNGNFSAGTVTAAFVGDGSGLTNVIAPRLQGVAPAATNFTAALVGDVTGGQGTTVVQSVGGATASDVAIATARSLAATPTNVLGTVVRRDPCDSSFTAGTITGKFVGDGSGLTNLPTTPPYYSAPSGAVLVSTFAQDSGLISAGYRQFMSTAPVSWYNGVTTNAPSVRYSHSSVWTGQYLIVWGGTSGGSTYLSSGAMYEPSADTWSTLSTVGAPAARMGHTTVWTDTQMIVWGGKGSAGYLGSGGRFSPTTQSWSATTTTGAPVGRMGHVSVWTGSKMVVWGGINSSGLLDDGAIYDPASNTWSVLSLTNMPTPRMNAVAVWAGDRMIVWGGTGDSGELDDGGQLLFTNGLPVKWLSVTNLNAPSGRIGHSMVWTGDRVIVWGGQSAGYPQGDGGVYCASCDEWKELSITNAPSPRYDHAAVWSGTEMFIVDGANASGPLSTGGAYDPSTQQWRSLSTLGSPVARSQSTAIWSGTEVIVFGGTSGSQAYSNLQRLSPQPVWYFYRKL